MSRAKTRLVLSYTEADDRGLLIEPSRFLAALPPNLIRKTQRDSPLPGVLRRCCYCRCCCCRCCCCCCCCCCCLNIPEHSGLTLARHIGAAAVPLGVARPQMPAAAAAVDPAEARSQRLALAATRREAYLAARPYLTAQPMQRPTQQPTQQPAATAAAGPDLAQPAPHQPAQQQAQQLFQEQLNPYNGQYMRQKSPAAAPLAVRQLNAGQPTSQQQASGSPPPSSQCTVSQASSHRLRQTALHEADSRFTSPIADCQFANSLSHLLEHLP